jgi:hypothetical protein
MTDDINYMRNLPHDSEDEDEWYLKSKDSGRHQTVSVKEIIIGADEDTKVGLHDECIQAKNTSPLNILSLSIPQFHFITDGSRIGFNVDLFKGGIVYCVYEGTKLLYIGQSYTLRTRLLTHHKVWYTLYDDNYTIKGFFVPFDTDRLIYELFLINVLRPILNIQKRYY